MAEVELADHDPVPELPPAYHFDAAKVVLCGNGCGTEVRTFPNGAWWIDTKNPPTQDPWWCPACLKAKCTAAVAAVRG